MTEEIKKKLSDKDFIKKIINLGTEEDVIKAFADENITITEKDVEDLGTFIMTVFSKMSEMSDDELKKISGGAYNHELFEAFTFVPEKVEDFIDSKTKNKFLIDVAVLSTMALEFIGLWEGGKGLIKGGKWLVKKGKENAWWTKLKRKLSVWPDPQK